jgi:hypothetical protein
MTKRRGERVDALSVSVPFVFVIVAVVEAVDVDDDDDAFDVSDVPSLPVPPISPVKPVHPSNEYCTCAGESGSTSVAWVVFSAKPAASAASISFALGNTAGSYENTTSTCVELTRVTLTTAKLEA